MKIPVGYITTPVYKVKIDDILHIHGEVIDVFESEYRVFFDEDTEQRFIASTVTLVFLSWDGEPVLMDFGHTEYVRVLKYAKVKDGMKPRRIFPKHKVGAVALDPISQRPKEI